MKVRVLDYCGRAGGAGFSLALGWRIWLGWARGALSNGGVFKRIGAVLSFRFWAANKRLRNTKKSY